ncbi:unnamed protein product [Bursaphelenchus xylophilus]|uniref:(pine wood nematode) hypothetical protein n=1 Tax=Bursaphelenchus xylophilus TaxID=6326 RepID=A0A1I7SLK9_BURXY|nr:unnamed protein product [Bursaphelenchus xylophilus]CAG9129657.1 unnamed protein product [Bursaphelenchus xylophilus]
MKAAETSAAHVEDENVASVLNLAKRSVQTDWRSIYVTSLLAFCVAAQFSLYFSSLWPFLQLLDSTISENFFGYVVGAYSFGQIIASPLVGFLSNKLGQIRLPLYANLTCMFIGNAIYFNLENFSFGRRYWLVLCRLITGFGSSSISLLKAYTTTASVTKDRSRALAFVTGGVALGMTMGPTFQLLFIPLDYPGFHFLGIFKVNMYTAPAYMACCMNLFCALITKKFFVENYAGIVTSEDGEKVRLPPFDKKAIVVCHMTRFAQILVNSNMETLGSPLVMAMFAWSRHEAVEYIAAAQVVMSFLAFLTYLAFIVFKPERFMSFRLGCLLSLVGLIIFHLLTISWPFLPGQIQTFHQSNLTETEQIGCNSARFTWCDTLKPVNVAVFFGSYILIVGTAFPNVNICLNTLFSKIIGPRRQGTQQGWLQVSGALARMFGPVVASNVYSTYGPQYAWGVVIAVIGLVLSLWIVFFERMVPLQIPKEEHKELNRPPSDEITKSLTSSST